MVSIGKLNYELGLDTKDFVKGAKATQQEMRAQRRIMRETDTAADKYEKSWKDIQNAYKKGHISADRARRALDKLNDELHEGKRAADKAATSNRMMGESLLDKLNPATLAAAGAAAALATAMQAGRFAVDQYFKSLERIDVAAKLADQLNISTAAIEGFQIAARRMSGATDDQTQTALRNMTSRLSKAAQGTGEAAAALEELGLNAEALAQRPEAAIGQIADAMNRVESQSDKLRLTQQIFGEENGRLVSTLAAGSGALSDFRAEAIRLGLALPEGVTQEVEALNDRMDEFNARLEGSANILSGQVTTEFNNWLSLLDRVESALGKVANASAGLGDKLGQAFPGAFGGRAADAASGAAQIAGGRSATALMGAFTPVGAALNLGRQVLSPLAGASGNAERNARRQAEVAAALDRAGGAVELPPDALADVELPKDTFTDMLDDAAREYEKERADRKRHNEAMEKLYEAERATYEKQLAQIDKEIEAAKKAEEDRVEHNKRVKESRDFDILVAAGSQRARTMELRARGFGPKKEVQQVRIADDQLDELVRERETIVEMEDEVGRPV